AFAAKELQEEKAMVLDVLGDDASERPPSAPRGGGGGGGGGGTVDAVGTLAKASGVGSNGTPISSL
ncbi:unnamed protein product, partial [Hapterophycus canaliculatus]